MHTTAQIDHIIGDDLRWTERSACRHRERDGRDVLLLHPNSETQRLTLHPRRDRWRIEIGERNGLSAQFDYENVRGLARFEALLAPSPQIRV